MILAAFSSSCCKSSWPLCYCYLWAALLTTKSTCRQQNTMPLKDEQVPELHGKMPNVTSETVEKIIVFGLPKAPPGTKTARLPAIVHQLPTTSYPTSYSDLWTAPATKAPADSWLLCYCYLWAALPPKAPADSKTPCHWRTNKSQNCTERCLMLLLKP